MTMREKCGREPCDVCGTRCDHGSECLMLAGHAGGHETQHGCSMDCDACNEATR